jgi:hypothetical protein
LPPRLGSFGLGPHGGRLRLRALARGCFRGGAAGGCFPLGPCGSLLPAPLGLCPTPGYCGFGFGPRGSLGARTFCQRGLLSGCTLRSLSRRCGRTLGFAGPRGRRFGVLCRGASVLCDPFLVGGAGLQVGLRAETRLAHTATQCLHQPPAAGHRRGSFGRPAPV